MSPASAIPVIISIADEEVVWIARGEHLHKPQAEVLADIADYADCIRCFHLSNRGAGGETQHLPLRHPDGILDFKEILAAIARSGFSGPLTLEYLPQFHDQLLPDGLWAADWLASQRTND